MNKNLIKKIVVTFVLLLLRANIGLILAWYFTKKQLYRKTTASIIALIFLLFLDFFYLGTYGINTLTFIIFILLELLIPELPGRKAILAAFALILAQFLIVTITGITITLAATTKFVIFNLVILLLINLVEKFSHNF